MVAIVEYYFVPALAPYFLILQSVYGCYDNMKVPAYR